MKKGYKFPDTNILTGGGDRGRIAVWVLTPSGISTPNSIHTWDQGKPLNEMELQWNDDWYWTENESS